MGTRTHIASPALSDPPDTSIFAELESEVQCYARSFPTVFERAEGSRMIDVRGRSYIDFLAGAGSLNYGHNHPRLKERLIDYIVANGPAHGLDMHTSAKEEFLETFRSVILRPRNLDYVVQFTGPTGANAVEAALKLARKVTGRHNVVAFTNGFHGVTTGALAATGNSHHREAAGLPLAGVTRMPYDGYLGEGIDTADMLEKMIADESSGVDLPAAVLLETVQGEGGLNVASASWLRKIEHLCRRHGALLIVDDIQAGCGRTGTFFSFEPAGIVPDIVTLSKSLSGYGLPFALTVFKRKWDQWAPGEHNGTFRGNNHAFVTAAEALKYFWSDGRFASSIAETSELITKRMEQIVDHSVILKRKGRGVMQGIECVDGDVAARISRAAFERGLLIETAGPQGEVVKCFCPLTISRSDLEEGLDILDAAVSETVRFRKTMQKKAAAE